MSHHAEIIHVLHMQGRTVRVMISQVRLWMLGIEAILTELHDIMVRQLQFSSMHLNLPAQVQTRHNDFGLNMIDREQLAWAAGFFDGEGSSSSGFAGSRPVIRANVSQAEPEVLTRFSQITGMGHVYGPYKPSGLGQKERWQWGVYNHELVQQLTVFLWPWLGSVKRAQFAQTLKNYRSTVSLCPHSLLVRNCAPCRSERAQRVGRLQTVKRLDRNNTIVSAFLEGCSRREISEATGLHYTTICWILRKNGLGQ